MPKDFHRTCQVCNTKDAKYDGVCPGGCQVRWAYMCEDCFKAQGIGLGIGKGQKIILAQE